MQIDHDKDKISVKEKVDYRSANAYIEVVESGKAIAATQHDLSLYASAI